VFNFVRKPEEQSDSREKLKRKIGFRDDEIFILQPTRIVPRKWIERSLEIVKYLNLPNPKLVISHASGDEGDDYYQKILEYSTQLGVKIIQINHLIRNNLSNEVGKYSIAEIYSCADLVTYPSRYEGFGNAFLEAVYHKKPIVLNRYPVYVADIEPKSFQIITFDEEVDPGIINKINRVLSNKTYRTKMVEANFNIARQYFSFELLEKKLLTLVKSFNS
jgi:glycosyltransferase involved in cell wall biosynthesis